MFKTTIVIFGGTGDLAQLKLIPALYNLRRTRRLYGEVNVVGFARAQHGADSYRGLLQAGGPELGGLETTPEEWAISRAASTMSVSPRLGHSKGWGAS